MYSRQATIITFHGPTMHNGPRYTARNAAGYRTVDQVDNERPEGNAADAAQSLLQKQGRDGQYAIGTLPDGRYVVVEVSDENVFTVGKPRPTGPVFLAQHIGTDNDTNGNPRRGWYVSRLDGSAGVSWIEEGYGNFPWRAFGAALGMSFDADASWWSVRDQVRPFVVETGRVHVTPDEYRSARKLPRFGAAE